MSRNLVRALSLCLLTISLAAGCSDHTTDPHPRERGLRYNEVSFKQTHNSFARSYDWVESLNFDPSNPSYGGVSGLEFDLLPKWTLYGGFEWGWNVGHCVIDPFHLPPTVDPVKYGSFANTLKKLQDWHEADPNHRVITVQLELKNVDGIPDDLPSWLEPFVAHIDFPESYLSALPEKLDDYIRTNFDESLLYRPADLMAGRSNIVDAAQASGWTRLEELGGRFIFVIHGQRKVSENGAAKYYVPNPEQRLCFASDALGLEDFKTQRDVVFWRVSTTSGSFPEKAIWAATQPGIITRGWPMADPWDEDEHDDSHHWAEACAYGINIVATNQSRAGWATVGTEPFWPIMKKQWEREEQISSGTCHSAPASAVYKDVVYVLTNNAPDLSYHTLDGGGWSNCKDTGSRMAGAPAAAVYHDVLWVAFSGEGGTNLWVTSYDGNSWNQNQIGTAADSPGMAVYRNELYLVYPRKSDDKLVYRIYDGSGWSGEVLARGASQSAPALCVFDNRLQAIYRGAGSTHMYMCSFDGSSWSSEKRLTDINGVEAGTAPAVVVNGDEMLIVTKGTSSTYMHSFSIKQNGEISGQRLVTVGRTDESVSLLNHDGEIWMFHRNSSDSGDNLFVQYLDTEY